MRNKKITRIIAIVLVALLAGGAVVSALISSFALAEEAPAPNRQEMTIEYLEDEQALHISQRLVYRNDSADALDAVVFYAAGNMFRRRDAIMYAGSELEEVFPNGYAPAGIDLRSVRFEGADADYGFQGEAELYLRVACELAPGQAGSFEFDYYLLLMECGAFQGAGETDVRLSAFYFAPGMYDESYHEFVVKQPLPFTRWLHGPAADFDVTLTLPEPYLPAATGTETLEGTRDRRATWRIEAANARAFALSFGKRWRAAEAASEGGVTVRTLTDGRGDALAREAAAMVSRCEEWFGDYPVDRLDIVQSDYPLGALGFPGVIWVPTALLSQEDGLMQALRFGVAQQIFGMDAYTEPSSDAWLSDSLCEYLSYLMLEEDAGRDAFLRAVNRDWVSDLQLTVPGGLRVNSDAALFDAASYHTVIRVRGAVVFHELREAMGKEDLLAGLRAFREMAEPDRTLTEMDLVRALNIATGGDWEAFLTDWVFNVGEYVNQTIDWFE